MGGAFAEEFAEPSYKWIGERRFVENLQGWRISIFPGGIGFSFYNYADEKALRVKLCVEREDGVREFYLSDAYYCGEWGGSWQKWQTHRLPLLPYEGLHGRVRHITFSYSIWREGWVIPSRHRYRFATLDDFHRGSVSPDDFHDPALKADNDEAPSFCDEALFQEAYEKVNRMENRHYMTPAFTRGDIARPEHPVHAIHMAVERVIERKREDPYGSHHIKCAVFDFDNGDVADHLVRAKNCGVEVECIGDWAQVSSLNASENMARLRRAGIPVYGFVRNDPSAKHRDLASMHTKFMIFDGDVVLSASYNLHFHLWGGNWENSMTYHSREASLLYGYVYGAIRHGYKVQLQVSPSNTHNLYYSFGVYRSAGALVRPQDAIITEIGEAKESILVCMFDLARLKGVCLSTERELDVIEALIQARDRGVRVRILLNGMTAHSGPAPEAWDKAFIRPLKEPMERLSDAWMEVFYVYYWESIYSPLHHKFAVIDGKTVITGSYNWYEASLSSDEVLLVVRDERIAGAFLGEAELMLSRFRIERR